MQSPFPASQCHDKQGEITTLSHVLTQPYLVGGLTDEYRQAVSAVLILLSCGSLFLFRPGLKWKSPLLLACLLAWGLGFRGNPGPRANPCCARLSYGAAPFGVRTCHLPPDILDTQPPKAPLRPPLQETSGHHPGLQWVLKRAVIGTGAINVYTPVRPTHVQEKQDPAQTTLSLPSLSFGRAMSKGEAPLPASRSLSLSLPPSLSLQGLRTSAGQAPHPTPPPPQVYAHLHVLADFRTLRKRRVSPDTEITAQDKFQDSPTFSVLLFPLRCSHCLRTSHPRSLCLFSSTQPRKGGSPPPLRSPWSQGLCWFVYVHVLVQVHVCLCKRIENCMYTDRQRHTVACRRRDT